MLSNHYEADFMMRHRNFGRLVMGFLRDKFRREEGQIIVLVPGAAQHVAKRSDAPQTRDRLA